MRERPQVILMKPSVIVWDLETVPDLAGFAAANDLVGKSDVEVREALGDKFPKHIYHSIVCIGALIAHREADYWGWMPWVRLTVERLLIALFKSSVVCLLKCVMRMTPTLYATAPRGRG
jgi:hypothetical protein